MNPMQILVVDDDAAHRRMLNAVLAPRGYLVDTAGSGETAVEKVTRKGYDLVLMDVRMAAMDGVAAMDRMIARRPGIVVILMTAYGSIDSAVGAMKKGARDYITKPVDMDRLVQMLDKIWRSDNGLALETDDRPATDTATVPWRQGIIAGSRAMQEVLELVGRVGPSDASVLILGESGTGKELIARALHTASPRKDKPFVTLNCAAIPEPLLESEMFGHEKGAFTGAIQQRQGRFRQAHGGTLFLDEIAEMAPPVQAKLLRVLQEKRFEPVGTGKTVQVDIRLISATNKDPASEIAAGRFREDLFYRLNVVTLPLPPLRERVADILPLARYFVEKYSRATQRHITGCTEPVEAILTRYSWPGNVRELENVVERAIILTRGPRIVPGDLPAPLLPDTTDDPDRSAPQSPSTSLKEMEKKMILKTLEESDGNRTRASEILGISRRTLQLKLKKYGVN